MVGCAGAIDTYQRSPFCLDVQNSPHLFPLPRPTGKVQGEGVAIRQCYFKTIYNSKGKKLMVDEDDEQDDWEDEEDDEDDGDAYRDAYDDHEFDEEDDDYEDE